jgi:hypothetical protein
MAMAANLEAIGLSNFNSCFSPAVNPVARKQVKIKAAVIFLIILSSVENSKLLYISNRTLCQGKRKIRRQAQTQMPATKVGGKFDKKFEKEYTKN